MTSMIRSGAPLWGVLLLALVGLVLGGLRAGGTGDRATPRDDPVPPGKAAAMESAVDMEGEVAEADAELLQPFADSGPATGVAAVKGAAPDLGPRSRRRGRRWPGRRSTRRSTTH